jgi:hypothetical protein
MEAGDMTRVFDALVNAGWEWRDGALYAPRGTMWLDGKEPWGGDIRSLHERMTGRVARLKNNLVGLSGTEATDLQRAVLDVEGLVSVLEGLLPSL